MRLVNIERVKEGDILARPVINSQGRTLLHAGTEISSLYVSRLRQLGFIFVFVFDNRLDDVVVHESIRAETRELVYKNIVVINKLIEDGIETLPISQVQKTIMQMIKDLLYSRDLVGNLSELRGYDHNTFHHSVNTTIIALTLGIAARLPESRLLQLGMGVLLHDVGKIKIPQEILTSKNPFSEEEFNIVKRHSALGYEILRRSEDLSLTSCHVAFQHHERWDGSGYPRGLKENEIHEFARLAAVADVYEALTSWRVYRAPYQPYMAFEYVVAQSGTHFDPKAIDLFIKHSVIYPNGMGVKLSNGQGGNVVKQNPGFPSRPHIRIFYQDNLPLASPLECNLLEHPSIMITEVDNR